MKKNLLSLFLVVAAYTAMAYPISPRPLRQLIQESEYIVIGHVTGITEMKRKKNDFEGSTVAHIQVRQLLKGEKVDEMIEVVFNPYIICPQPARYKENTDVVIFLDKGENGRYYTHALAYGARKVTMIEADIYRMRIQEMQQILTITDKDQQFKETVEWLVKCAEHPETRWDGVYELSPESHFMSYYSDSQPAPFKYMLSAEQKERLKNALLTSPEATYTDFGLVDLVYPQNEEVIYQFLLARLKKLDDNQLWLADEYMTRLNREKESAELDAMIKSFDEKKYANDNEATLKDIVNNFIAAVE